MTTLSPDMSEANNSYLYIRVCYFIAGFMHTILHISKSDIMMIVQILLIVKNVKRKAPTILKLFSEECKKFTIINGFTVLIIIHILASHDQKCY